MNAFPIPAGPQDTTTDAARDAEALAGILSRDARLPGLAEVLDPGRLCALLDRAVTPTRVRYKPGAGVVVAYVDADGAAGWASAHVDPEKTRKAVTRASRWGVPVTEHAPGLLSGPVEGDRVLGPRLRTLATGPDARILRYNPHRRIVIRDGAEVIRVAPDGPAPVLLDVLDAAGVPLLPAHAETHGVSRTPWWGDGDLVRVPSLVGARSAGEALAALHASPVTAALPSGAPLADELAGAVAALDRIVPGHGAAPIAARLARTAPPRAVAPAHGDFSADQVLVREGEVRLIDFDRARSAPPARDVGSFLAEETIRAHSEPAPAPALTPALLDGYRAAGGDLTDAEVTHAAAVACLLRAAEPFRTLRPGWRRMIDDTIDLAEGFLT